MKRYADLHVNDERLSAKAKELGFFRALVPLVFVLKKGNDADKLSAGLQVVESKSSELLSKACAKTRVLVNPLGARNFWRDDGLIRAVADNDCLFEIAWSYLLVEGALDKAKRLKRLRDFIRKCLKLKARFVFVSGARSEFDLKSPREIAAIGVLLGLSQEQAQHFLSARSLNFLKEVGER